MDILGTGGTRGFENEDQRPTEAIRLGRLCWKISQMIAVLEMLLLERVRCVLEMLSILLGEALIL